MSFKAKFYEAVREYLVADLGFLCDEVTDVEEERHEHQCCGAFDVEVLVHFNYSDEDGHNYDVYRYLGSLSDLMDELP
jgi:hypothetical protein